MVSGLESKAQSYVNTHIHEKNNISKSPNPAMSPTGISSPPSNTKKSFGSSMPLIEPENKTYFSSLFHVTEDNLSQYNEKDFKIYLPAIYRVLNNIVHTKLTIHEIQNAFNNYKSHRTPSSKAIYFAKSILSKNLILGARFHTAPVKYENLNRNMPREIALCDVLEKIFLYFLYIDTDKSEKVPQEIIFDSKKIEIAIRKNNINLHLIELKTEHELNNLLFNIKLILNNIMDLTSYSIIFPLEEIEKKTEPKKKNNQKIFTQMKGLKL